MWIALAWLLFGIVAAMIGSKKGEGCGAFILGILLGPFGILIAIFSKGNRKTCPFCKELVHKDARVCPHCQREIGVQIAPQATSAVTTINYSILGLVFAIVALGLLGYHFSNERSSVSQAQNNSDSQNNSDVQNSVRPITNLTEAEFNSQFRCPETYSNDEERKQALDDMLKWYASHHKTTTIASITSFRMQLLEEHNCSETLKNIAANNANPSPISSPDISANRVSPSFDCTKARSDSEKLICKDSKLSSLDSELSKIYERAKAQTLNPAAFKKQNIAEWKWREINCHTKECLLDWYARRKAQLLQMEN
jgi:hypothetical protein